MIHEKIRTIISKLDLGISKEIIAMELEILFEIEILLAKTKAADEQYHKDMETINNFKPF